MRSDEVFPPESVDEQIEQWTSLSSSEAAPPEFEMIVRLSRLYRADQQSTERVWQRLTQRIAEHNANVQQAFKPAPGMPPEPEAGRAPRRPISRISRRTGSSWLAQAAAVLIAALVVGSLLGVLYVMHSSRTTQLSPALPSTPPGLYFYRSDGVYRLNAQTRNVIWHTRLSGQSPFVGYLVLMSDTVYIASGDTLWALEASSGALRWSRAFQGNGLVLSMDKGLLYVDVILGTHALYAVNPKDGKITATYKPPQRVWNTPTIVNGILYYTLGTRLYAVRLPGEKLLWQQQVDPHAGIDDLSVQGGIVYLSIMRYEEKSHDTVGLVDAFDVHSGRKLWQLSGLSRGVDMVRVTDKMLYVDAADALFAFDVHTHRLLWQQPFNTSQILQASGTLYISYSPARTDREGAAALSATTGKVLWQTTKYAHGGYILAGVHNGIVYGIFSTGQGGGTIFALNARTGSQLWTMPTGAPALQWGGMAVA